MNKFQGLEFTNDGYIISNGCYIGLKGDEWDWYGDIDLAREMLKPIINMNIIADIKDYLDFVQGDDYRH